MKLISVERTAAKQDLVFWRPVVKQDLVSQRPATMNLMSQRLEMQNKCLEG